MIHALLVVALSLLSPIEPDEESSGQLRADSIFFS
jgi:hypothetical protein